MHLQCVAWLAVLVLAHLPTLALAQSSSCPGIHVQILNIRNSTGTVDCALFDAPEGFPIEVLRSATNVMVIKVRHTQARCDFETSRRERLGDVCPPHRYDCRKISTLLARISQTARDACNTFLMHK
jgi:hypothetical protein